MRLGFIAVLLLLAPLVNASPLSDQYPADAEAIISIETLSECRASAHYYIGYMNIAYHVNARMTSDNSLLQLELKSYINDTLDMARSFADRQKIISENHLQNVPYDVIIAGIARSYLEGLQMLVASTTNSSGVSNIANQKLLLANYDESFTKCRNLLHDR